jgi:hypothetical protein
MLRDDFSAEGVYFLCGKPAVTESTKKGFERRIYSDATLAGLSALIPIPLVDLMFEGMFRRRMPAEIAETRERQLDRWDRIRLGRGHGRLVSMAGCLAIPVGFVRYLFKKMWRKIIYVFAVADAANLISEYWHRAYLLDHMISAGHLEPEADSDRAIQVFMQTLREVDTGALVFLAREVIAGTARVLRLLMRAGRHGSMAQTESISDVLRYHWGAAERALMETASRYNELYVNWPGEESS